MHGVRYKNELQEPNSCERREGNHTSYRICNECILSYLLLSYWLWPILKSFSRYKMIHTIHGKLTDIP